MVQVPVLDIEVGVERRYWPLIVYIAESSYRPGSYRMGHGQMMRRRKMTMNGNGNGPRAQAVVGETR